MISPQQTAAVICAATEDAAQRKQKAVVNNQHVQNDEQHAEQYTEHHAERHAVKPHHHIRLIHRKHATVNHSKPIVEPRSPKAPRIPKAPRSPKSGAYRHHDKLKLKLKLEKLRDTGERSLIVP